MRPTMSHSFRIRRARDGAIRNRRWAMRLNSTELWRRAMDSAHGHFVTRVTSGTPAELSSSAAAINVTSDDTDPGPGAGVLALVVEHHPDRAGTDLRTIRGYALGHGSILPGSGASGKPGTVQLLERNLEPVPWLDYQIQVTDV